VDQTKAGIFKSEKISYHHYRFNKNSSSGKSPGSIIK